MKQLFQALFQTLISSFVYFVLGVKILLGVRMAKSYILHPNKHQGVEQAAKRHLKLFKIIKALLFVKKISVNCSGFEKVPKVPVLYVANYHDYLTPLILFKVLYEQENHPLTTFVAPHQFHNRTFGYLFDLVDGIFLTDHTNWVDQAQKILQNRRSLVVFLTNDQFVQLDSHHFLGDCAPALKALVPIVPVVVQQLSPSGQKSWNRFGRQIELQFHQVFQPPSFINTSLAQCNQRILQSLQTCAQQTVLVNKDNYSQSDHALVMQDLKRAVKKIIKPTS